MSCETYLKGDSPIRRIDPRCRVVAALGFTLLVAIASSFAVLGAALLLAALISLAADLPPAPTIRRLVSLNLFMLLLFLLLPLSSPGEVLFKLGPLAWSSEGVRIAAVITLKANTIVLTYTALLSTIDPIRLGQALHRLKLPEKLVHLLLFTIRYIDVVHHEYDRLVQAMRIRCFRPRLNLHTLRTYGYLFGMLLVNSFDRSDRVVAAMKCRGFRGRFYTLSEFSAGGREAAFAVVAIFALFILGWIEWA
ncbi:MAG TPA: cobalt ECF transporter T component CbiQ [Acidobacteriota bacterium]|nr:cobalt ECF transporter T component CbiQ [Acidobacteriota bacterium]